MSLASLKSPSTNQLALLLCIIVILVAFYMEVYMKSTQSTENKTLTRPSNQTPTLHSCGIQGHIHQMSSYDLGVKVGKHKAGGGLVLAAAGKHLALFPPLSCGSWDRKSAVQRLVKQKSVCCLSSSYFCCWAMLFPSKVHLLQPQNLFMCKSNT